MGVVIPKNDPSCVTPRIRVGHIPPSKIKKLALVLYTKTYSMLSRHLSETSKATNFRQGVV